MRFYNHYDLEAIGEEEIYADIQLDENYLPVYHLNITQLSGSTFQILVEENYFSNPVFEKAFKSIYGVAFVKVRSYRKLVVFLNYTCRFPSELILRFQKTFDETMENIIKQSSIKKPLILIPMKFGKAS